MPFSSFPLPSTFFGSGANCRTAHLAGFELQVIASLATRVTAFHAASPRSMAKLSVIPLSLSRTWDWDLGVQVRAVQDHMLWRDPHLLNTSRAGSGMESASCKASDTTARCCVFLRCGIGGAG